MPQEIHVLRCCHCKFFQGHIIKKSNKWKCKVCGAPQTIQMVYGNGTGKECRIIVQKLNKQTHHDDDKAAINTDHGQHSSCANFVPDKLNKYLQSTHSSSFHEVNEQSSQEHHQINTQPVDDETIVNIKQESKDLKNYIHSTSSTSLSNTNELSLDHQMNVLSTDQANVFEDDDFDMETWLKKNF